MTSTYIATFYAHIGAISFNKYQISLGNSSKMMPVPRSLSSSCGTCVQFESDNPIFDEAYTDEIEQIVLVKQAPDGKADYIPVTL